MFKAICIIAAVTATPVLFLVGCETNKPAAKPQPGPATSNPQEDRSQYRELFASLGDHCYPGDQFPGFASSGHPGTSIANVDSASPAARDNFVRRQATSVSTEKTQVSSVGHLAQLSDIEVAEFKDNELTVIGPPANPGEGFRPDDWHVVFRAIAGPEAPGVSIDPGPNPHLMQVRYFGGIQQTALGNTFFEADRTLKLLGTGFDNLTCTKWLQRPPNTPTELDFIGTEIGGGSRSVDGAERWHRFWLTPTDDVIEAQETAVGIPKNRVTLREESVPAGLPGRTSAREFAASVSARFPSLSAQIPSFRDLHRDIALVMLAKWMRDKRIPADENWIHGAPKEERTASTTPSITVMRALLIDQAYLQYGLHGGVDMQKENRYGPTTSRTRALLAAARKSGSRGARFWQFSFDGNTYRAVRLRIAHPVPLRSRWIIWQHAVTRILVQPSIYRVVIPDSYFGNFVVTNATAQLLTIQMAGPINRTDYVQPGTAVLRVIPGSYRLSATTPTCGGKNDAVTVAEGVRHQLRYECRQRVETLQLPAPVGGGSFVVNNNTGAAITVSIQGKSYAIGPGSSTIQLSPGSYRATITAKCGTTAEQFDIQNGSTFTGQYWCGVR